MAKALPPATVQAIVEEVAQGKTLYRDIAKKHGVSEVSVKRVKKRNLDVIEGLQDELREASLQHLRQHGAAIRDALTADVLNPDSRSKAQSARVLGEYAGSIGKGAPLVHIGDVHNAVVVDARSVNVGAMSSEELERERAELEKKLGF